MCNVTLAKYFLILKNYLQILGNLSVKELINDYIGTII